MAPLPDCLYMLVIVLCSMKLPTAGLLDNHSACLLSCLLGRATRLKHKSRRVVAGVKVSTDSS